MKPGEEGRYANNLRIGHNALEFILEFGQAYEGDPPVMHTRIVTHPSYAKLFAQLLAESVKEHEQQFGAVD